MAEPGFESKRPGCRAYIHREILRETPAELGSGVRRGDGVEGLKGFCTLLEGLPRSYSDIIGIYMEGSVC